MAEFFRAIGVPPALGRAFSETEEVAASKLIVLTDRLWRRQFGADPGILRRKIFLNEEPYSVTGVMPSGFEYPMGRGLADAFIPLSRRDYCCSRLGQQAVARLRPGARVPAARAELPSGGCRQGARVRRHRRRPQRRSRTAAKNLDGQPAGTALAISGCRRCCLRSPWPTSRD